MKQAGVVGYNEFRSHGKTHRNGVTLGIEGGVTTMSVTLDREFATAKDTAAALGVSDKRLKRLLRLFGPQARAARIFRKEESNGRLKPNIAIAKRRKHARGKAKKAAR
jgi:hypothetical protein